MATVTVATVDGQGVLTNAGTNDRHRVYYRLIAERRPSVQYRNGSEAMRGEEFRGEIEPIPEGIEIPSRREPHTLELEDGTILECRFRADGRVICQPALKRRG